MDNHGNPINQPTNQPEQQSLVVEDGWKPKLKIYLVVYVRSEPD
jgi:hypothetical protein